MSRKMVPGDPVYYFPGAIRNSQTNPMLGWIQKPWDKNCCDLLLAPNQDGTWQNKLYVPHADDERLFDAAGKPKPIATQSGSWCFKDEFECGREFTGADGREGFDIEAHIKEEIEKRAEEYAAKIETALKRIEELEKKPAPKKAPAKKAASSAK